MATYYVDAARADDTGDGLSWGAAKKTIGAAVTAAQGGAGPHTVNVRDGTYAESVTLNHANLAGLTLQGDSRLGTIIAGGHVVNIGAANINGTIRRLTLRANGAGKAAIYKAAAATGWTFSNLDLVGGTGFGYYLFQSLGGSLTITGCRFLSNAGVGGNAALKLEGDSAGTISYSLFLAGAGATYHEGISIGTTGAINLYNNVVFDAYTDAVYISAGTVTLVNNILQAGLFNNAGGAIRRDGGTVTANRNLLFAHPFAGTTFLQGTITEGAGADANIKTNANPAFRSYGRTGYLLPRIDDTSNLAYAQSVAALFTTAGVKGTFMMSPASWAGNLADLRGLISGGVMEVGAHGYSHTTLTITGKIFDVTKAAETITIDRAADTITLSGGGSVTAFKSKTLAQIKTALEGLGATVTGVAGYGSTIATTAFGEIIANGAAVNVINVLRDATAATGLEKAEIAGAKSWLVTNINSAGAVTDGQTGQTYACNSFAFPTNGADATSLAGVAAAGFTSSGHNGTGSINQVTGVTDVNLWRLWSFTTESLTGADEAGTRALARALGMAVASAGLVVAVLAHTTDSATVDEWTWMLDEWAKFGAGIAVTSHQLFASTVRTSGLWTDDGDGTWSRSYGFADLHLKAGSPAINAGADVGLTTDFDGRTVPQGTAPDLGAYEYAKSRSSLIVR